MTVLQVLKGEYYYHFKHDISKGVTDHAYLIIGTGVHTETEEVMVVYKSLYYMENSRANLAGADYNIRPLNMFLEQNFEKDGKIIKQRFTKIEGQDLENLLKALSN
jgi:hypothetical protein